MNETHFNTDQHTLIVKRTFDAPLDLVWKAWTDPALLDRWWAPKPWKSRTRQMDFSEGGYRLYAMVGPGGEEHWARTDYRTIVRHKQFSGDDSFCNEDGEINDSFPVAHFTNTFTGKSGQTEVGVISEYDSREHLEQILEMGIKEGLAMAFENLDEVLNK